jgi:hypothetical protein
MRRCSRTLDKPLLILGLEGEDVAVLMMVFGVPAVLISPSIPVMLLFAAWPALVVFKRGKPEGYVLHFLYKFGMPLQGLLPPGEKRRYGVFTKKEGV